MSSCGLILYPCTGWTAIGRGPILPRQGSMPQYPRVVWVFYPVGVSLQQLISSGLSSPTTSGQLTPC